MRRHFGRGQILGQIQYFVPCLETSILLPHKDLDVTLILCIVRFKIRLISDQKLLRKMHWLCFVAWFESSSSRNSYVFNSNQTQSIPKCVLCPPYKKQRYQKTYFIYCGQKRALAREKSMLIEVFMHEKLSIKRSNFAYLMHSNWGSEEKSRSRLCSCHLSVQLIFYVTALLNAPSLISNNCLANAMKKSNHQGEIASHDWPK